MDHRWRSLFKKTSPAKRTQSPMRGYVLSREHISSKGRPPVSLRIHWVEVVCVLASLVIPKSHAAQKIIMTGLLNAASNSTGYDCGVYVICVTEELCKNFLGNTETSLIDKISAEDIRRKRKTSKELILDLGQKKTWLLKVWNDNDKHLQMVTLRSLHPTCQEETIVYGKNRIEA